MVKQFLENDVSRLKLELPVTFHVNNAGDSWDGETFTVTNESLGLEIKAIQTLSLVLVSYKVL